MTADARRHIPEPGQLAQVVGVCDGLSARIADAFGFDWLHIGGYTTSGAAFGMPDVGLLTLTEIAEAARRVVGSTDAPVLVDGDDGYGKHLNVMRLVKEIERTGAAGVHLEDQVFPKKCGHMEGKRVVPAGAFVSKIKAFVDTRRSDDFLLFARTDAIAVEGFEAAIERAHLYREAGADVIFIEAPTTLEEAEAIPRRVPGPLLYNWVFRGKSPLVPLDRLAALGYAFCLQADVLYPVARAMRDYYAALKRDRNYDAVADRMLSFDAFNDLVGLEDIVRADQRYGG